MSARYAGPVEVGVALEAVETVEHEELVVCIVRDELVQPIVVVAEIHHVDVGVVGRQVRHEAVGVTVLDDENAPGAVAPDAAQAVVAVEEHGILVVNVQLGRVIQAGGLAVGGLAGTADRVDGQRVRQVVVEDGVWLCIRRPCLGVVGAIEAVRRQHGVGRGVKRREAQSVTELLVGIISAGACPVVVGAVVDIFVFVVGEGLPHPLFLMKIQTD